MATNEQKMAEEVSRNSDHSAEIQSEGTQPLSAAPDGTSEDKAESVAGTAATGLGCLAMAALPWTMVYLAIALALVVIFVGRLLMRH